MYLEHFVKLVSIMRLTDLSLETVGKEKDEVLILGNSEIQMPS
jgi:hypothetical protein